jgi:hypothetical protein
MKGNINSRKFSGGPASMSQATKRRSTGNNDLRAVLAKKPRLAKKVLVVVENLPDRLNGDEAILRLMASYTGVVEEVVCDVERRNCSVVFKNEAEAESFYLATNEKDYEGTILVCRGPQHRGQI